MQIFASDLHGGDITDHLERVLWLLMDKSEGGSIILQQDVAPHNKKKLRLASSSPTVRQPSKGLNRIHLTFKMEVLLRFLKSSLHSLSIHYGGEPSFKVTFRDL